MPGHRGRTGTALYIVAAPRRPDLLLLLEEDEVDPGPPQTGAHRQASRSGADDDDLRSHVFAARGEFHSTSVTAAAGRGTLAFRSAGRGPSARTALRLRAREVVDRAVGDLPRLAGLARAG